jgi:CxxC-x17-CxxC domain-containing protein
MRDFKRGGRDFKRRDFDRPQVAQAMHQAICSNCGKTCEVPFKPNGTRPVFCRECFQANRTGDARRPDFEGRNNNFPPPPPRFDDRGPHQPPPEPHKEQFAELNAKLDKILNILNEAMKKPVVTTPVVVEPEIAEIKVEKTPKIVKTKVKTAKKK